VTLVAWTDARWLNPPERAELDGSDLVVTTRSGSDFWRRTSYGFDHDDGHALLTGFPPGTAVEVTFGGDFDTLYDQAGVLVRVDPATWTKAGIEVVGGMPNVASVVTREYSDCALAPAPRWAGRPVTVRASRSGDALTIRVRADADAWRLVRIAPMDPEAAATAGPYCCSPQRGGLTVRFTRFALGPPDTGLHEGPPVS